MTTREKIHKNYSKYNKIYGMKKVDLIKAIRKEFHLFHVDVDKLLDAMKAIRQKFYDVDDFIELIKAASHDDVDADNGDLIDLIEQIMITREKLDVDELIDLIKATREMFDESDDDDDSDFYEESDDSDLFDEIDLLKLIMDDDKKVILFI